MLLNHNTSIFNVKKIRLILEKYVKFLLQYFRCLCREGGNYDYIWISLSRLQIPLVRCMMLKNNEGFMKKIIFLLCVLLIGKAALSAEIEPAGDIEKVPSQIVLTGNLVFDWLDISQLQRDAVIEKYRAELFDDDTVYKYKKKDFRAEYKDFLKDKDFKRHYMLVKNGVKETDSENLCGFYRKNLLISYAIQYKKDLRTVYYYDAMGNLRYIDKFSENYPNFPYMSKQYRANGTLVSAIYFMSHDMQYMYEDDKSFKGAWYKDKMYDRHAKQVLTRTNW